MTKKSIKYELGTYFLYRFSDCKDLAIVKLVSRKPADPINKDILVQLVEGGYLTGGPENVEDWTYGFAENFIILELEKKYTLVETRNLYPEYFL